MIIKKEFYVVSCNSCGDQYSGAPDCGFTVYDTKQAAIESMTLEGWVIKENTDDVLCPDCHAEKVMIDDLSTNDHKWINDPDSNEASQEFGALKQLCEKCGTPRYSDNVPEHCPGESEDPVYLPDEIMELE